jgi:hypothetical protein
MSMAARTTESAEVSFRVVVPLPRRRRAQTIQPRVQAVDIVVVFDEEERDLARAVVLRRFRPDLRKLI